MSFPLISTVITTYNYGQFVEEAIESVLSQDYPLEKVEIVVVDDGSTDNTPERVRKYGTRIKYIKKMNGGQASALNRGITSASGEIISLMDADDIFLPGKLARVADAFQRNAELGMVYHRLQEWHVETGERREWPFREVSGDVHKNPKEFFWYVPQPTSAISFRRSCLAPLLSIPERIRMLADCYLVALIPFVSPVLAMPEFLTVYRIHGKNSYSNAAPDIPREDRAKRLQMWHILIEEMEEWLAKSAYTGDGSAAREFLWRWALFEQSERFLVAAPGRLEFFRHLMLYDRCYGPYISGRLRAINYFNAFGALLTGYGGFHAVDAFRNRAIRLLRQVGGERAS